MALEDLAALRAVYGSVVLYPADATATVALVEQMADTAGVVYLRTTRGSYPVLYSSEEPFPIGGSKVHRAGSDDQVTLIGAGVTLHECLAAADELDRIGIPVRVIDLYSIKPIDLDTLTEACRVTEGRLVIVEDHYPAGGLGGAVLEALVDPSIASLVHFAWPISRSRAFPGRERLPSCSTRRGSLLDTSSTPPAESSVSNVSSDASAGPTAWPAVARL
jgi:Transketolase, C-terminal subunit